MTIARWARTARGWVLGQSWRRFSTWLRSSRGAHRRDSIGQSRALNRGTTLEGGRVLSGTVQRVTGLAATERYGAPAGFRKPHLNSLVGGTVSPRTRVARSGNFDVMSASMTNAHEAAHVVRRKRILSRFQPTQFRDLAIFTRRTRGCSGYVPDLPAEGTAAIVGLLLVIPRPRRPPSRQQFKSEHSSSKAGSSGLTSAARRCRWNRPTAARPSRSTFTALVRATTADSVGTSTCVSSASFFGQAVGSRHTNSIW
jgi:hypothetical protein